MPKGLSWNKFTPSTCARTLTPRRLWQHAMLDCTQGSRADFSPPSDPDVLLAKVVLPPMKMVLPREVMAPAPEKNATVGALFVAECVHKKKGCCNGVTNSVHKGLAFAAMRNTISLP